MAQLMEGVHVLSQKIIHITEGYCWGWTDLTIILFICGLIMLGLAILFFVAFKKHDNDDFLCAAGAFALIAVLCFGLGLTEGSYGKAIVRDEVQYKVIIDDTVNFTEFQKRYEIIEQDGYEYIVKEKEESN